MASKKYRVVIADDHPIVLEGVQSLLLADERFQVVGTTGNGHDVAGLVETQHPDVVVLDLSMPNADGTEIIDVLRRQFPNVRIVIHTVHTSPHQLHKCLLAGVSAYVVKGDPHTNLLTALVSVMDGHNFLSPSICKTLIDRYLLAMRSIPTHQHFAEHLSRRESDVLRHLAQGLTIKQIAKHLTIEPKTVNNNLGRLKKKLNLNNRSALIRYALTNQLIEQDA